MEAAVLLLTLLVFSPSSSEAFAAPPIKHVIPSSSSTTTSTSLPALPEVAVQLSTTYSYCLEAYQLPTQMATFGAFSATGDAIAQQVEAGGEAYDKQEREYDPTRTFHYLLKGLGGGIIWSSWYSVADPLALGLTRAVGTPEMLEPAARVAAAIFLEQMVACPVAYALWDVPVPALLRGAPVRSIPGEVRAKLGPLLLANAKVWTPVNVVTYNLPPEWRLPFCSVMDLLWQSVNSRITSKEM